MTPAQKHQYAAAQAMAVCGSCNREIEGSYCPHCVLPAHVLERAESMARVLNISLLAALTCINVGREMAA